MTLNEENDNIQPAIGPVFRTCCYGPASLPHVITYIILLYILYIRIFHDTSSYTAEEFKRPGNSSITFETLN